MKNNIENSQENQLENELENNSCGAEKNIELIKFANKDKENYEIFKYKKIRIITDDDEDEINLKENSNELKENNKNEVNEIKIINNNDKNNHFNNDSIKNPIIERDNSLNNKNKETNIPEENKVIIIPDNNIEETKKNESSTKVIQKKKKSRI